MSILGSTSNLHEHPGNMVTDQLPLVSICIPAYNQTTYLDILLRSIAGQTFTAYEIIVSDDSTTEDVKQLTGRFPIAGKIKYYRNQPSLGSPSNWNAAIQRATGRYIKIMHHDDAFNSNTALAEMVSCMEANQYDYIFTDSWIENVKDPGRNRRHTIRNFDKLIRKPYLLFFGNSIGSPSTLLIKKEMASGMQYNPQFIWLVDMEYYSRLLHASSNTAAIPRPLILTHDAAEHRLTSQILPDFSLQVREQAMLYNDLLPGTPAVPAFFMQVYLARLLFKGRVKDRELTRAFTRVPVMVNIYFSLLKYKPLYFAYYIFTRIFDMIRKILL